MDHWIHHFDWRAQEHAMNAFEHWRVSIDGVPIHFVLERGSGPNPLPLVLTHGWPWTFWEYRHVIGPLADPGAHGGDPADVFDFASLSADSYSEDELAAGWFDQTLYGMGAGFSHMAVHVDDPQTLAYGLSDSPAGLAAWMLKRRRAWSDCGGDVESRFSKDELLTSFSLYWLTTSFANAVRMYPASFRAPWSPAHDKRPTLQAPVGIAVFPKELALVPRQVAEEHANLTHWSVMPRGGHFAPAEEPELVVEDIRRFFRPLRS